MTDNLATKKGALAELLGLNAQGALVRSRFQGVDQMDVPQKKFFSLEKKNGQRKCIHSLKSEYGTLLTSVHDIRSRAVRFYEDLYRSELSGEKADIVFMEGLPQVSAESLAELDSALKRPVSLLCNDYKLLSKALANRLCRVIDQVIHPDQTYCIPSRSIFDNVALVRDGKIVGA